MPFVPLQSDAGGATPTEPKQGFTPIATPLEYNTNPIVERAKYVAGVIPGIAETAVGGGIDFAGNVGAAVGGMIYGTAPAIWKGQKINWSDPNNPFYQEYAKENSLWQKNISPVLAPQTEAGKDIMGGFTNIAEKMKGMGQKVTDITGSEAAGAWTEAALQTLGIPLGLKALGVVPMVGAGVAARMAGKGTPEAVAPESASVADQLKAIRPEAPVKPPETPTATPPAGEGKGFTPEPTAAPAPVWPEAGAKPTPEQEAQMAKDAEAYRKLQEETKTPEKPVAVPPGAAGFEPKPGDVPTAPRHGVPGVQVQEILLAGLKLSEEVPQFKKGADKEGIIAPLGGKPDRVGMAPIQIWERLNGDKEVISGRHRRKLFSDAGEETIPAQIHREADGFDAKQAAMMDAELNIRDEQGGVYDYANYFRNSGIDQETANAKGLLARAKGKAGWAIGRDASDEVFAAHGAGVISDEAALAFSRAAPKDGPAQAVGLKMINEGRSVQQAENTIRAIAMMEKNGEAKPEQGDIFGFDDSAIRQAEEMAKRASAAQRAIREQLAAVSGATKRPDIARKLGVIVEDPESVKAAIDRLRVALDRLANWPLYPDLVREFRGEEPLELKGETEAEIQAKESAKAKAAEEERARAAAPPPEDFVMTGSTRPADEAAARGQNDMFGNTPLEVSRETIAPEAKPEAKVERRNAPERDAMYGLAKGLAEQDGKIGISKLRRHYPQFDEMKAARVIGQLEADGVIGPQNINTGSHELLKGETVEKATKAVEAKAKQPEAAKLSIGRTPNSAEPLSVRDGTIYIGEYPATNFETGEDVTIADDATPQQIKDALTEAGAIGAGQKIFGMKPHEAKPHEAEVKPVSDTVRRIMAERERAKGKELAQSGKTEYIAGKKYHQKIPEVTRIRVANLKRMDSGEVASVSDKVASSMDFSEPINVSVFADGEMRVSDGHHRVAAARQRGIEFLPVDLQAINAKGEAINQLIQEAKSEQPKAATKPVEKSAEAKPGQPGPPGKTPEDIELEGLRETPLSELTPEQKDRLAELEYKEEVRATNALEDATDEAVKKEEFPSVNSIVNLNIGVTPADLARGVGQIAEDAKAVLERAKATKMGAAASDWLDAVKSDIQTKVVPMAAGTDRARAIAKDFANADRQSRWQWAKFDDVLKKNFTAEQRQKMWDAAEEENQIRMDKVPEAERKGRGLDKLTPEERATMDTLHQYGEDLLQRAKDVGMFKGTGVEYWSPRIVAMIGEDGTITTPKAKGGQGFTPYSSPTGGNISVTASSLKARKHATVAGTEAAAKLKFGEGAQVVRDIRTMPMAMARIERAIAGKELINHIKEVGKETGQDLTSDAAKEGFFTIDHPAFKTYRYRPDVVQKEAFDKLMMDQLNKFATDIGVSHERVARMGGNRWGVSYQGADKIKSRFGGPETVITHEIGHQLDHKYGLAQKFVNAKDLKKELRALADLRYEGAEDQVSNYYKKYVREGSEKIANMVHAYVHTPEKFKAVAPNTYGVFTQFLKEHPELKGLNDIKPSLRLGTGSISKRPPGEDFDVFPVYVSREFEGPLKAIMTDYPGKLYQAMMDLKGKSMSVIMYSPLIHNGVEYGRAMPLMPGRIITFKAYYDGAVAKRDPAVMRELINDGMVPIGHRFFMQDISGIMEDPNLQPGRSWTAKIAGALVKPVEPVTRPVAKAAGTAVDVVAKPAGRAIQALGAKRLGEIVGKTGEFTERFGTSEGTKQNIDILGDWWHNTLLWDRIGDLQAGIAVNVKADLIKKGMDPQSAGRVAGHLANRFAGALPNEAMSANARKVANFMFFSRTFTLGNLGVMKDMISGLPRDVQAQILRDAGPVAAFAAKNASQRAAIKSFSVDIALMYGANAALQSGFDMLKRDKSLDDIEREYVDRFNNMLQNVREDPTNLLKPFAMIESLTPMATNEPGKEQRVLYDYDKNGTAIYVRLPTGKIGEEFLTWTTSPLDILGRKEGTMIRPITQLFPLGSGGDAGYGRRIYDPNLPGYKGAFKAAGSIAYNFLSQQFPTESLQSALDIMRHQSDETDALKVIGPLFGLTFSKGASGGPEMGMMYTTERMHRAEISEAMPDIKRYIKQGNMEDAVKRMYDAHMTPAEIRATIKFSQMPRARLTPQAMKKFYETATPEQQQKMQDIQENAP